MFLKPNWSYGYDPRTDKYYIFHPDFHQLTYDAKYSLAEAREKVDRYNKRHKEIYGDTI